MARPLKVAVQMDPIETVNIDADSTFALMLEAQSRGHSLWHYEVRHMALKEGVSRPAATAPTTSSNRWQRSTSAAWTWC
jgi:glutathione synthase